MNPLIILLIVLGAAAVIAVVAFVIHRLIKSKDKNNVKKIDEQQCAKEELQRVLMPVEDEEAAKAISEYQEKDE